LSFCGTTGTIAVSSFRVNPVGQTGRPPRPQSLVKLGLANVVAVFLTALLSVSVPAWGRDGQGVETVSISALPPEAHATQRSIVAGGPFPHAKDGSVFANRERRLPGQARGYYREYTVATPGVVHRGARRIVCGGSRPRTPDACYYSADHYTSFKRIVQ
jgi:ribonuclease T1